MKRKPRAKRLRRQWSSPVREHLISLVVLLAFQLMILMCLVSMIVVNTIANPGLTQTIAGSGPFNSALFQQATNEAATASAAGTATAAGLRHSARVTETPPPLTLSLFTTNAAQLR
ncbi:MAG: hypothetical protein AAF787_10275 [Chloroflexota bacterium]